MRRFALSGGFRQADCLRSHQDEIAHQSWSTLVYSMNSDLFPSGAMASITGLAGALGSASTILFAEIIGRVLQHDPNLYLPLFIACGTMYMLSFLIIHLLVPRFEPAKLA